MNAKTYYESNKKLIFLLIPFKVKDIFALNRFYFSQGNLIVF